MTERRKFLGQRTRAEASKFIGLEREITVDQQSGSLRVHDSRTPGGSELATANLSNVEESYLLGKLGAKEDVKNKTQSLTQTSTDYQYPSAKVVYNNLILKQDKANLKTSLTDSDTEYPSCKAVKTTTDELAKRDLTNLTDEGKTRLLGAAMPDYKKAQDRSLGTPHTETVDGYVLFECYMKGSTYGALEVDGLVVISFSKVGNVYAGGRAMVPVGAGSVYKTKGTADVLKFIPLKGV